MKPQSIHLPAISNTTEGVQPLYWSGLRFPKDSVIFPTAYFLWNNTVVLGAEDKPKPLICIKNTLTNCRFPSIIANQ